MVMTGPRTCGATFVQNLAAAKPQPAAPKPPPAPRRPEPKPEATPTQPDIAPPPQPSAGERPGAGGGGAAVPGTVTAPIGPGTYPAPPPILPEQQAKNDIQRVLKDYCFAYEALNPVAIRQVYPTVPGLEEQLRQLKSIECTLTSPPEFVDLNADAGTATVEVGVKQVFDRKVGGVQKQETIATIKLLRPQARGTWRIASMNHKQKK